MLHNIGLFFLVLLCIPITRHLVNRIQKEIKKNIYSIHSRKTNSRNRILTRFRDQESNRLIMNPNKDIEIYQSDEESDLRVKADIHKTRLSKHGKSKLNGKIYFKGPKGGVFILNNNGNKRYI